MIFLKVDSLPQQNKLGFKDNWQWIMYKGDKKMRLKTFYTKHKYQLISLFAHINFVNGLHGG